MTQTQNRFFDEGGPADERLPPASPRAAAELDTMVRTQAERILRDLDVVKRESSRPPRRLARLAREENEVLKRRIEALEAALGKGAAPPS